MVEQFAEFKELKNIDKTTMISVLESPSATYWPRCLKRRKLRRNPQPRQRRRSDLPEPTGNCPTAPSRNPTPADFLSDARADTTPPQSVGEEHTREIIFEKLGRRAISTLRDPAEPYHPRPAERGRVFNKFKELEARGS